MKNNIKSIREQRGITQKECADTVGITLRAWQTYEQGVREPKQEVLFKIADMFNVSLDCLLGREPLPNPFADFHLTKEIEDDMLKKYLALPEGVRVCVMDAIRQLGKTMPDDTQNGSEDVTDDYITITERAEDIVDQVENADEKDGVS